MLLLECVVFVVVINTKEYTKYFVNGGHDLKSVQQCFITPRQEARKKVKPRNTKNLIVFSTSFNPHGQM